MSPTDLEHPDAVDEAIAIARAGGAAYEIALGEVVEVLKAIASGRDPDDLLYEHGPFGAIRLYARQFWGRTSGQSVVAVFGVKGARCALLTVVPVGLARPGVSALDYSGALSQGLTLAQQRCAAM
jgi:hypothetical protein